jgi:hypothetical protein
MRCLLAPTVPGNTTPRAGCDMGSNLVADRVRDRFLDPEVIAVGGRYV